MHGAQFDIPLHEEREEKHVLKSQNYDFQLKFKQSTFRKHISNLQKLNVTQIDFGLYQPYDADIIEEKDAKIYSTFFTLQGHSDEIQNVKHYFHSTIKVFNGGGKVSEVNIEEDLHISHENKVPGTLQDTIEPMVPNFKNMKQLFCERFKAKLLEHCTKNLDKSDMTIRLTTKCPLTLEFKVGDRNYIHFILAPMKKEEEGEI